MSAKTMEGKCLCGAVSIVADAASEVGACHCGMCRRWGGGPLLAVHGGSDVKVSGANNVAVFDSSEWAERGFCKTCGTHLFYRLKPTNEYELPAGLFQNQEGLALTAQIYVDSKPDYYEFANQTKMLTEAQVIEQFAPK